MKRVRAQLKRIGPLKAYTSNEGLSVNPPAFRTAKAIAVEGFKASSLPRRSRASAVIVNHLVFLRPAHNMWHIQESAPIVIPQVVSNSRVIYANRILAGYMPGLATAKCCIFACQ
eukprot:3109322-Pleurochrysis_carterae.AAC.3